MDKYGGSEVDAAKALKTKKKDVYVYDFLMHKPRYVYSTEESRFQKTQKHYDKFANDAGFKKALGGFYGIDHEFPKPDYGRRGPITNQDEANTSSLFLN